MEWQPIGPDPVHPLRLVTELRRYATMVGRKDEFGVLLLAAAKHIEAEQKKKKPFLRLNGLEPENLIWQWRRARS